MPTNISFPDWATLAIDCLEHSTAGQTTTEMSKKSCKSYTYVQKSNQARLSESDLMGVKSDKKRADDAVKRAFSVILCKFWGCQRSGVYRLSPPDDLRFGKVRRKLQICIKFRLVRADSNCTNVGLKLAPLATQGMRQKILIAPMWDWNEINAFPFVDADGF